MFLHLGNGVMVPSEEILFIGDYALFTETADGRALLQDMQKKGRVLNTLPLHPRFHEDMTIKSVIQTKDKLYLSLISPLTLKSRAEKPLSSLNLFDKEIDLATEEEE